MLLCSYAGHYYAYRAWMDLLGHTDRKAIWDLARKDQRVNLAFQGHLEDPDVQVHIHFLDTI